MRTWARLLLLVLLLGLLPALAALDSRSLFSPDETNYSQVAREMMESGDFTVPHRDGVPWFNKPPLAYWFLAASFWLLGWGFPAAVLLNTLLTATVALTAALHVARTASNRAATATAVAYLTMALPIAVARTALTDPTLVLFTTAAVVLFLKERRGTSLLAGACLGLGVLAKGPVAPLVVLPAMAVAAILRRSQGGTRRLLQAILVAAAVIAPWQAALVLRGVWSAWAAEFLGQEIVSRATDTWRIAGPWWYYAPALWVAAFPWGTHLLAAVRSWWRRAAGSAWRDPTLLGELAAVATPVLAFSLATNKLPHYILPVMPFLAIWLGRASRDPHEPAVDSISRRICWAATVLGASFLAVLAILVVTSRAASFLPSSTSWFLVGAALVFVLYGSLEASGRRRTGRLGLAALAIALRLGLDISLVPHLDSQLPERPLAEAAAAHLPPRGQPVAHRWWRTAWVAYGVRGWIVTEDREELSKTLAAAASDSRPVLVMARSDSEEEVRHAAWQRGSVAREVARIAGLGEIDGEIIEGIVFLVEERRGDSHWFWNADGLTTGEQSLDGVESNPWTRAFRWTTAHKAGLEIRATPGAPAVLRLAVWGIPRDGEPQRARISLNGCPLDELALDRFPRLFTLPIPAECLRPEVQVLTIEAAHLTVPAEEESGSEDLRALGVAINWLALEPEVAPLRLTQRQR